MLFSVLNRHLGLDLVPRKEFEMVDADQISVFWSLQNGEYTDCISMGF